MNRPGSWLPWRSAWEQSLYGPLGFYRHQRPADHFRTSVHASALFADAILALVRRHGLDSVTDYGAGSGELVTRLHRLAPNLVLTAVDVRPRPSDLPKQIGWSRRLPPTMTGLLLASELLDNVPCDVVQLDDAHRVRVVEVCPDTGEERLGGPVSDEGGAWLSRWWPLVEPGDRAEVGLSRDDVWRKACGRLAAGLALAVDYGHLLDERPEGGTLASYRCGRQTLPTADGRHDVTAHVAFDSVAAGVGAEVRTQRESLADLGVIGTRPELTLATTDPAAYVRALSRSTQAAELSSSPGLGDFYWLVSRHSCR